MRHRAGELDRKITIEQFIESQDDFDAWAADQTKIPDEEDVSSGVPGGKGAGVFDDRDLTDD